MDKKEYVLAYLHFAGAGDAHKLRLSPGRRVIAVLHHHVTYPKHELLCLIEIGEEQPNDQEA